MKKLAIALTIVCAHVHVAHANDTASDVNGLTFSRTVYIGASAKKVWNALTEKKEVAKYYLAPLVTLEKKQGGEISYGSPKNKMITGKVLEIMPQEKLSHSFLFSHRPQEAPSRVTYSIKPLGEMSVLTLTHDRFPKDGATYQDVSGGWEMILSSLKTILETGKPLPWPKQDTSSGK